MRIRILSDLHLEFGSFEPPPAEADVVVLAGDIDVKARGPAWAAKHFDCPVIYVPGNHEYYGGRLAGTLEELYVNALDSNVRVLDMEATVLDGVRFLGATLWTDFGLTGNQPLAMFDAERYMNDYRKIRDSCNRRLTAQTLLECHTHARQFLERELAKPFDGKTVVVTHHGPTLQSISERYLDIGGHINACYASNLEHLMGGERVALWVHGHTHESRDYEVAGTRVVCNPRGYAGYEVNPQFRGDLVVTI